MHAAEVHQVQAVQAQYVRASHEYLRMVGPHTAHSG